MNFFQLLLADTGLPPQFTNGLLEWLVPSANKITYDSSKIIVTDNYNSSKIYRSRSESASPTFNNLPSPHLDFDGIDDVLYSLMYPRMLHRTTVPDLPDSVPGKGYTVTGLKYDSLTGNFWSVNEGRSQQGDGSWDPSIVELSINVTTGVITKLQEIKLLPLIPTIGSVQDITIDTSNNTLWVASLQEDKLHNITKAGVFLGSITVGSGDANGLEYDPDNDEFWICKTNALKRYDRGGNVTVNITTISADLDCIHYDYEGGLLYITSGGTNGVGPHKIVVWDVTLSKYYNYFGFLDDIVAIEGITRVGNRWLIASDEFFHEVGNELNQIAIFDAEVNIGIHAPFNEFMYNCVLSSDDVNAGIIWSTGEVNNDIGMRVSYATLTGGRFEVNSASGTSKKTLQSAVITNLNTKCLLTVVLDLSTRTMTFYQNGTQKNNLTSVNPDSMMRYISGMRGNWIASDTDAKMKLFEDTLHINNNANRQFVEGELAWNNGIQGDLPLDHPYKNSPPF